MIYDLILKSINKYFFIIYHEKYKNDDESIFIDRFIAKHPLLRPKLIILNDQAQGFQKIDKNILSLEQFPIFIELQYSYEDGNKKFLTECEIYTESDLKLQDHLSEMIYLSKRFKNEIICNRIFSLNEFSEESIAIYSKLSDHIFELDDHFNINEKMIDSLIETQLKTFLLFIQSIDALLIKGKSLDDIHKIV